MCVYPTLVRVAKADSKVPASRWPRRTAFPSGQADHDTKLQDLRFAISEGADEVDMVISRGHYLKGEFNYVYDEIAEFKSICGDVPLKVILETGELGTLDRVRHASDLALVAGGDFIKTSTGKVQPAATQTVTLVMLEAVRDFYQRTGQNAASNPPVASKRRSKRFNIS